MIITRRAIYMALINENLCLARSYVVDEKLVRISHPKV